MGTLAPFPAVQLLHNSRELEKPDKRESGGQPTPPWHDRIASGSGLVDEGVFYTDTSLATPCGLVVLHDFNTPVLAQAQPAQWWKWRDEGRWSVRVQQGAPPRTHLQFVQSFAPSPAPYAVELFRVKPTDAGALEFHLDYNYWTYGIPERDNHLAFVLSPGGTVEFRINGKRDYSMSRGRQRIYIEHHLRLSHLGLVHELGPLPAAAKPLMKPTPIPDKLIDYRKPIY